MQRKVPEFPFVGSTSMSNRRLLLNCLSETSEKRKKKVSVFIDCSRQGRQVRSVAHWSFQIKFRSNGSCGRHSRVKFAVFRFLLQHASQQGRGWRHWRLGRGGDRRRVVYVLSPVFVCTAIPDRHSYFGRSLASCSRLRREAACLNSSGHRRLIALPLHNLPPLALSDLRWRRV